MIQKVEIVKAYPKRIWAEKDLMGTVHIKMQHEWCEEFDFIQIQYDYRYTSNTHQENLTKRIRSRRRVPRHAPAAAEAASRTRNTPEGARATSASRGTRSKAPRQ